MWKRRTLSLEDGVDAIIQAQPKASTYVAAVVTERHEHWQRALDELITRHGWAWPEIVGAHAALLTHHPRGLQPRGLHVGMTMEDAEGEILAGHDGVAWARHIRQLSSPGGDEVAYALWAVIAELRLGNPMVERLAQQIAAPNTP